MINMSKKAKYNWIGLISIAVLLGLDQWTKQLAVLHLKDQNPFVIWDGVFELRYSINKGAAFGILQNQRIFFIISTCLVLAAILYCYHKIPATKKNLPLLILCVSVTAGALGNFIDRLYLEYVIDFLYFKLINFPIFNVADIYITVSCFVFMFLMFFFYKEEDLDFFGKQDKKDRSEE